MSSYCDICGERWTCFGAHRCPPAWFVMSPDLGETDLDGERVFAESPQRAAEKWAADRRGSAGGTRPLRVKVFKVGESRCHWFEVDKEVTSAWHAHATGAPTEATRPAPPYLYVVR